MAQKIVCHSPRCRAYSRNSTERREDARSKLHDIEVRGAVKPARAIAHDEASSAGLSQWADLGNWLQDHQRYRVVPRGWSSTSLFGMTWLVLSNETQQPKPLNRRIPERENGTVDRNFASVGRWDVFMWQRRTKGLLYNTTCFGYDTSLSARAARRLLPRARAPGARSSQLNVTRARANGRPKRTGAHLRAMEPTRPAGDRPGARGSVFRLDLPPPSSDAP